MKVCSRGGVGVYTDYKENIIVEADHPILEWKACKKNERLRPNLFLPWIASRFPEGFPYISSENSEDVLSWNIFRSLQLANKISLITDSLMIHTPIEKVYFWQHDVSLWSQEIDNEIKDALDEIEPWGRNNEEKQQTETDVILRSGNHTIMVECKLGKPNTKVKAWSRSGDKSRPMRSEYLNYMAKVRVKPFNDSFDFENDGRRFYQLFRNYLLGNALSIMWNTQFSLLSIVNDLNSNLDGRSHEDEFHYFRSKLSSPSNTFLITWQQVWESLPDEPQLAPLRVWLLNHPLLCLSSLKK
jgi:hypothetical protein